MNNNLSSINNNLNGNQSSDENEPCGGESSDKEDVILQTRSSTREVTKEDEEFIKAFDSVITENIVVNLFIFLYI